MYNIHADKSLRLGKSIYLFFLCYMLSFSVLRAQDVQNGVADLRDWHFETQKSFELNGEWDFALWKFIAPSMQGCNDSVFKNTQRVPNKKGHFYEVAEGVPFFSYGTYRLKVILNHEYIKGEKQFALFVPSVASSYRLWIDSSMVVSVGAFKAVSGVGKSAFIPKVVKFYPVHDTTTIIIQYENSLVTSSAGIIAPISIGLDYQIVRKEQMQHNFFLAGSVFCFATGLFFLFLIVFGQDRLINTLSFLLCAVHGIRFLVDEAYLITSFYPKFDGEMIVKTLFLVLNLVPILVWIGHRSFPDEIKRTPLIITLILYSVWTVIIIAVPFQISGRGAMYFVVLSDIILLYLAERSYRAYKNKRELAGIYFFVMIFTAISFMLNVFVSNQMFPIGSIMDVLLITLFVTKKMAYSHNKVIQLSGELLSINKNLEYLVEERTKELNEANSMLKKLNFAKDRFISILSHDLRNPLNYLIGLSKNLIKSVEVEDKDKVINYSKMINESALAGKNLAENLLEWSLIQTGAKGVLPEKIGLNKVTKSVIEFYKNEAITKSISFVDSIQDEIYVHVDSRMIESIFRNIITNAIKFTPHNGTIKISAEEKGHFCEVTIQDTGVGIPADILNNLFKIDKKTYSLGTDNEPGTGYGLILTKEFVEYNGGSITISSGECEGTSVRFTLPLLKPEKVMEI